MSERDFQTRVTLAEAPLSTSALLFCMDTNFPLRCFMLLRLCGLRHKELLFCKDYNCRNEVEGTMLEERFGLGEWEKGGVGGEDAENCTFW